MQTEAIGGDRYLLQNSFISYNTTPESVVHTLGISAYAA